jgi:GNAT superfamily N-acetyltransferase
MTSTILIKEWRKDDFLISTNQSLLSISAINAAFATDAMYWAKPLPEETLKLMLSTSMCFGLYKTSQESFSAHNLEQIGLARAITDHVTFVYLTDVYVLQEYQGKGLGTWLVQCVDEWIKVLEFLRRSMLVTGEDRAEKYYESKMGMTRFGKRGDAVVMDWKGPGAVFF